MPFPGARRPTLRSGCSCREPSARSPPNPGPGPGTPHRPEGRSRGRLARGPAAPIRGSGARNGLRAARRRRRRGPPPARPRRPCAPRASCRRWPWRARQGDEAEKGKQGSHARSGVRHDPAVEVERHRGGERVPVRAPDGSDLLLRGVERHVHELQALDGTLHLAGDDQALPAPREVRPDRGSPPCPPGRGAGRRKVRAGPGAACGRSRRGPPWTTGSAPSGAQPHNA